MHPRRLWLAATALMFLAIHPAVLSAQAPERLGDASHECVTRPLRCGETRSSSLDASECFYDEEKFADQFSFAAISTQTVTITLTSTVFQPQIALFSPVPALARVQDGAGGTAVITQTLGASGEWRVAATSTEGRRTGAYTISLQCSTTPLPGGPFLTSDEFPDFRFKVRITSDRVITGVKEADCQEDTLCVSGAVPGRPEVFIRIVGPRSNGFLWPNIIKFSTSQIEVWIQQVSTGQVKYYVLPAAGPTSDELEGLFDRTGFQP